MKKAKEKPEVNMIANIVHRALLEDLGLDRIGVAKKMIPELEAHLHRQIRDARIDELKQLLYSPTSKSPQDRLKELEKEK